MVGRSCAKTVPIKHNAARNVVAIFMLNIRFPPDRLYTPERLLYKERARCSILRWHDNGGCLTGGTSALPRRWKIGLNWLISLKCNPKQTESQVRSRALARKHEESRACGISSRCFCANVSAFFLIGFVVERLATADRSITKANRAFNCAYTVFFQVFDFTAGSLFAMYVYSLAVKMPGKGLISLPVSDRGILPFAIILAFTSSILRDFFYYWFHRLQHASRWLWAQRALHHRDECMNVTTTWRHHWLEMPMETVAVIVPAAILFKSPIVTIPLAYLITRV